MSEEAKQNHGMHERIQEKLIQQCVKEIKQKSWTEKNVLISLIKDEVESFSGTKFYADDNSEEGRQV